MWSELNDWVTSQLPGASVIGSIGLLFLGGALASLLPCVYPLYPITVATLQRRRSAFGPWLHPAVYYVGLILCYAALGAAAASTGGAFSVLLRAPLANLAIGIALFAMALAVVGALNFPVFQTSGPRGDSVASTFILGAAVGLLSSACVGPVVVSVLLGVVSSARGGWAASSVALASLKLACFGAGVGGPVLGIGVLGLSLPKSGRWIPWVQRVFGVAIGIAGWSYAAKGLEGYGFSEEATHGVLLSGSGLLAALYFLQSADVPTLERTKRAVLGVSVLTCALVMIRLLLPLEAPSYAAPALAAARPFEEQGGLRWYLEKDAAYAKAKRTGKPVFIDFFGEWYTNCKAFEASLRSNDRLRSALDSAVLLKVYYGSELFQEYRADSRLPELGVGLPFFLITDATGNVLYKTTDFTRADDMMLFLPSS